MLAGCKIAALEAILRAPLIVLGLLLGSLVALALAPMVAAIILGAFTIALGQDLFLTTLRLINGVYTWMRDACRERPCVTTQSFRSRLLDTAITLLPIPACLDIRSRKDDICPHCVQWKRHAEGSFSVSPAAPDSRHADPAVPDVPERRPVGASEMREMLQRMDTRLAAINDALCLNDYGTRETIEAARQHHVLMAEAKEIIAELRDIRDSAREPSDGATGPIEYDRRSTPAILAAPLHGSLGSSSSSVRSTAGMEPLHDPSGCVQGFHSDPSVARDALSERRHEALISGSAPRY
ncbi:hypothetical protein SeLEV6574_g07616 [Synchytrium endobioticum]|uniref:Uncharacterized protein n=1 Tax=Synchytrium endobioticum TaxID=286115 RepID=A0A507CL90_9FUNG|nr:hypothetical protein SeLEV6574_g07616 [Synchytrium endobioticum]